MSLHFRSQRGRFKRNDRSTTPTATPDNRQWETDLGNGFVRVDNGAPPPRLPSESQPVSLGDLKGPVVSPTSPPIRLGETAEPAPRPKPVNHNTQPINWQREFGLGRA